MLFVSSPVCSTLVFPIVKIVLLLDGLIFETLYLFICLLVSCVVYGFVHLLCALAPKDSFAHMCRYVERPEVHVECLPP